MLQRVPSTEADVALIKMVIFYCSIVSLHHLPDCHSPLAEQAKPSVSISFSKSEH